MPRILLVAWISIVIILSLAPLTVKHLLRTTGPWHDGGHFLIFFVTMMVSGWKANSPIPQWRALYVLSFGALLEVCETKMYHNAFEWHDIFSDGLGVIAGLLVLLHLHRIAVE